MNDNEDFPPSTPFELVSTGFSSIGDYETYTLSFRGGFEQIDETPQEYHFIIQDKYLFVIQKLDELSDIQLRETVNTAIKFMKFG